ncbi:MAG TPA: methyltransferase [Chthoniobacterales bacterium]|jgi:protein-S-isoprenylcysteine O-methyltransferase Ste14
MKLLSFVGLAAIVVALLFLLRMQALFSAAPWVIALQVAALLLMVWARVTFGVRSFHPGADPTAGGLVTRGPYRFVRHPIYAAILLFLWVGIAAHWSPITASLGALATAGLLVRIFCEEKLVSARYPEYRDCARRTKRIVPGLW